MKFKNRRLPNLAKSTIYNINAFKFVKLKDTPATLKGGTFETRMVVKIFNAPFYTMCAIRRCIILELCRFVALQKNSNACKSGTKGLQGGGGGVVNIGYLWRNTFEIL